MPNSNIRLSKDGCCLSTSPSAVYCKDEVPPNYRDCIQEIEAALAECHNMLDKLIGEYDSKEVSRESENIAQFVLYRLYEIRQSSKQLTARMIDLSNNF
jgi:hypothetical protein